MSQQQAILISCGVCCVWPLIVAAAAIAIDRRVRIAGWRSLLPHKEQDHEQ